MYTLNEKIRDLEPYEPIAGEYKIRLDANESFLCLPESVMASALHAMMRVELNRYPDPTAKDLCAAFAKSYKVKPACVAAGNGSDELINVIFQSFLMKGETYATLTPDFSMYDFCGYVSECRGIEIKKDENFTIDIDKVIETCNNENVKLLIFSNPCNPTSVGLTREAVRKIIRGVSALVVLDEAYMDFWNESMLGEFENYDNLLILKTCSKAFGLAALRVGDVLHHVQALRAALGAGVAADAGVDLRVELHHNLLRRLDFFDVIDLFDQREKRQRRHIHVVFDLCRTCQTRLKLAVARNAVDRRACAAEAVAAGTSW